MILTGSEITKSVKDGSIVVDPFKQDCINPNSYNYHLGSELRLYVQAALDPHGGHVVETVTLTHEGLVLSPGTIYLGATEETIGSTRFVPSLIGKSSLGRLGLYLQVSADLGNLGAIHNWTLELVATQSIRVYPGMIIGQVSFWVPCGDVVLYEGHLVKPESPSAPMPIDKLSH